MMGQCNNAAHAIAMSALQPARGEGRTVLREVRKGRRMSARSASRLEGFAICLGGLAGENRPSSGETSSEALGTGRDQRSSSPSPSPRICIRAKGVPDRSRYVLSWAGCASRPGEIPDAPRWTEEPRQGCLRRIAAAEAEPGSECTQRRNLFSCVLSVRGMQLVRSSHRRILLEGWKIDRRRQ